MLEKDKFYSLEKEILDLRKKSAVDAQIGEFVSKIYELQDEKDVFDCLEKHLYELTTFDKLVFLSLITENAELKVSYFKGFHKKEPDFSFDIFENPDENIISAVFDKKTTVVKNGYSEINDLSLRLDMDSYIIIPMIIGSEIEHFFFDNQTDEDISFVKEREILKYIEPFASGVFIFDCKRMNDLEISDNISICEKIISLAAKTIKNILVLGNLLREIEKNKKELEQAKTVQEKLLPENLPNNSFLQSAAFYIPVDEVGGDYYDLFMLEDGVYAIIIADVSGHGVSAALVMSAMKILLKSNASADLSPAQTLRKINEMLINYVPTGRFVTAFYAIIDTNKRKFTYTCAGHCPILLFNKETKDYNQFQSDGFFIGMFPEFDLPDNEYTYPAGKNRLLLYTDGFVESSNKRNMQYGLIRLKNIVMTTLEKSVVETIEESVCNLQEFIGNRAVNDDITLLIVDF